MGTDHSTAAQEAFAARVYFKHIGDGVFGKRLVEAFGIPAAVNGAELTLREREVLALVSAGLANASIGRLLCIGEETVKTHVKHVLAKVGATNRAHLTALALRSPHREGLPATAAAA